MDGSVVSNNTTIRGAFAVLPNHTARNNEDGSAEMSMYEPCNGITSLAVPEGSRSVRQLTFQLKDRLGADLPLTGRIQLWFKLDVTYG